MRPAQQRAPHRKPNNARAEMRWCAASSTAHFRSRPLTNGAGLKVGGTAWLVPGTGEAVGLYVAGFSANYSLWFTHSTDLVGRGKVIIRILVLVVEQEILMKLDSLGQRFYKCVDHKWMGLFLQTWPGLDSGELWWYYYAGFAQGYSEDTW